MVCKRKGPRRSCHFRLMRLTTINARFRRPALWPPPLLRVGYHVDRRGHLSLAAFDSTMSCSTHPVQYRVNRWLGSPVFRRPKTANGSATGAPVSGRRKKTFSHSATLDLQNEIVKETWTSSRRTDSRHRVIFVGGLPEFRLYPAWPTAKASTH